MYPISYLNSPDPGNPEYEWAPVRLNYEQNASKPAGATETISIRPPSVKGLNGEVIPGETFAFVEQKVATFLGPMLGKGLIRLDAKIRRTNRSVSAHIFLHTARVSCQCRFPCSLCSFSSSRPRVTYLSFPNISPSTSYTLTTLHTPVISNMHLLGITTTPTIRLPVVILEEHR